MQSNFLKIVFKIQGDSENIGCLIEQKFGGNDDDGKEIFNKHDQEAEEDGYTLWANDSRSRFERALISFDRNVN